MAPTPNLGESDAVKIWKLEEAVKLNEVANKEKGNAMKATEQFAKTGKDHEGAARPTAETGKNDRRKSIDHSEFSLVQHANDFF